MTTDTYDAAVDDVDDVTPCHCSDCDWRGPASATKNIDDCTLTPGDSSPVGRCPKCDTLAYIDQPVPDVRKVVRVVVDGAYAARTVAQDLVRASAWFRFEPLPDDQFEFYVRTDRAGSLPTHQGGKALHQTHMVLSETWSKS